MLLTANMKLHVIILLFFIPNILLSQFDDKEMYVYSRLNVSVGMRDFTFSSSIEEGLDNPLMAQLKLSSGITPEIGIGFMMLDHFFVEGNVGYTLLNKNGYQPEGSTYYIDTYNFNRLKIGVNGVYYVDIDSYSTLFGTMGVKANIPENLQITTSHSIENLKYNASVTFTTGFGGNFNYNNFIFGVGLHFNMENYTLSKGQELPPNFLELNPDFSKLKLRSMILNASIKYLF